MYYAGLMLFCITQFSVNLVKIISFDATNGVLCVNMYCRLCKLTIDTRSMHFEVCQLRKDY